jgi:hypothetical protein
VNNWPACVSHSEKERDTIEHPFCAIMRGLLSLDPRDYTTQVEREAFKQIGQYAA